MVEPVWDIGSLGYMLGRYKKYWPRSRLSVSTQRYYTNGLKHFHSLMHRKLGDVSLKLARVVVARLGNGAAYQALSSLSAALSWAVDQGQLEHNPLRGAPKPSYGEWAAVTSPELERVLTQADPFLRAILMVAVLTAQRRSDLINALISDEDRLNNMIWFKQSKTGNVVPCPITVELNGILRGMDELRGNSQSLLVSPWLAKWSEKELHDAWKKASRKAGVDKPFHGLRKLRAIQLAEAGATVPELMAVLGHSSPAMSSRYVNQASKITLARNAAARLGVLMVGDA